MNNFDKSFFLNHIDRVPVQEIFQKIKEEKVTMDEIKRTGKVDFKKQAELKELFQAEEDQKQEVNAAWQVAKQVNTIDAYEQFLSRYPSSSFNHEVRNRMAELEREIVEKKNFYLEDIRANPNEYSSQRIQDLLTQRMFTREELIQFAGFTENALELMISEPEVFGSQDLWKDLPPLKLNRTDIYFLGSPSSGKSTMLAGMLYYARMKGRLELAATNITGTKYANDLIKSIEIGYVPPSTTTEGVNYIECDFLDSKDAPHPLNIIEMSGELFDATYESGGLHNDGSIGAKTYLKNENRKIIFLIVDFKGAIEGDIYMSMSDQQAKLELVLRMLKDDRTLKKADAVHIVLTKSDLLPNGAQDRTSVEAYIDRHYLNLRKIVKRLKDEFRFDAKIYAFSLGKFMNRTTFIYDEYCSSDIFQEILANTFTSGRPKRTSIWGRLRGQ